MFCEQQRKASSSAGVGGGSLSAYETALVRHKQTNGPTQTRLTNTSTYSGQLMVRTNANAANTDEAVVGDLEMGINFDANSRPITATVDNPGREIDGTQTAITRSLTTANAPNQVVTVSSTTVNIHGQGSSTIMGMSVGLEGNSIGAN